MPSDISRVWVHEDLDAAIFQEDDDLDPTGLSSGFFDSDAEPLLYIPYIRQVECSTEIALEPKPVFGARALVLRENGRSHRFDMTSFVVRRERGFAVDLFPPNAFYTVVVRLCGQLSGDRAFDVGDQFILRHAKLAGLRISSQDNQEVQGSMSFSGEYEASNGDNELLF